jgi:hypothetical protein
LFGEEAHNSFLDPFMSGGWLGGATWFALTLVTLLLGLRHSFIRTPWQATYIATFAAFVGEVGESYVIDVQHWRHYFLLMGVLWGLMANNRNRSIRYPIRQVGTVLDSTKSPRSREYTYPYGP